MDFRQSFSLSSSPSGYYSSSEAESLIDVPWERQMRLAMARGEPDASQVTCQLLQVNCKFIYDNICCVHVNEIVSYKI